MSGGVDAERSGRTQARVLALSVGVNLALGAGLVALLLRGDEGPAPAAGLDDPELRAEVVAQLASEAYGIHDSHVDAEIGRVLFAGVDRASPRGERVRSNQFGMRERAYELPKPEGLLRVVLLGDSLVFGLKAEEHERLGAHLESSLRPLAQAADPPREVEVLSLGIASWNVWNEVAFLRRQVGLLQPDLVVHVLTDNDLSDSIGVRGFGAMATFAPDRRERADARVVRSQFVAGAGKTFTTPLLAGLDHESRMRRQSAWEEVARLARVLESLGSAYVPLVYGLSDPALVLEALVPAALRPEALVVSAAFRDDPAHWVAPGDRHWGSLGGERLSQALLAWMGAEGLLDAWGLRGEGGPLLPEAAGAGVFLRGAELAPAERASALAALDGRLVVADLATGEAAHVYAGLDGKGQLRPWSSFVLVPPGEGARGLMLRGRGLGRPELGGALLRVWVEGRPVGQLTLPVEGDFESLFVLPEGLGAIRAYNVVLECDDHVLVGGFLQQPVVATLELLELQ